MSRNLEVRNAEQSDVELVMSDGCIALETLKEKISRGEVVVATSDGTRLGYARVDFWWSSVPYLSMVWVLEEYRGQGVGRALILHLESRLRSEGHVALYSSSDADEPEPQAWHRRMGFEECGFIVGINAGGVGEIIFRKLLTREQAPQ